MENKTHKFWVRDPKPYHPHPRILVGFQVEDTDEGLLIRWASATLAPQDRFDRKEAHRQVDALLGTPFAKTKRLPEVTVESMRDPVMYRRVRVLILEAEWAGAIWASLKRMTCACAVIGRPLTSLERRHWCEAMRKPALNLYLVRDFSHQDQRRPSVLIAARNAEAARLTGHMWLRGPDLTVVSIGKADQSVKPGVLLDSIVGDSSRP